MAVDISLAALLGEDVYNFGELLLHPIVSNVVMVAPLLPLSLLSLPCLHEISSSDCLPGSWTACVAG